jgi:hypothetical protein
MFDPAASRPGEDDEPLRLEIGPYRLSLATSFGPRVLSLRLGNGPEMLAELGDDVVIDRPDSGVYRFHGGHRLWASPELPWVTYSPDDEPCLVEAGDDSVSITGPTDRAGLTKKIVIGLQTGTIVVDHTLANAGSDTIGVAPWAITQLRLGGVALVPTLVTETDVLQASHSLVLWPYTDLSDPRLSWRGRALVVDAVAGPPFKVGIGPRPGQLGYLIDRHLFIKGIASAGPGDYPDRGAVGQIYLNDHFCELESAGPLVALDPGSEVQHRELWAIEECDCLETAYQRIVGGEAP